MSDQTKTNVQQVLKSRRKLIENEKLGFVACVCIQTERYILQ